MLLQTPVPITSWNEDSVTVAYSGTPAMVRYNWYTAPCEPAAGILLCAVYAQTELLPAAPFVLDVFTL